MKKEKKKNSRDGDGMIRISLDARRKLKAIAAKRGWTLKHFLKVISEQE